MGAPIHAGDRWPTAVIDSWIWGLPHSHFRVLFACVALASAVPTIHRSPTWGTVDVPARGLVTSLARLAERVGVTVAVVRGALARLAGGPGGDGVDPAITVVSSRRGYTLITVGSTAYFGETAQPEHEPTAGPRTPIAPVAHPSPAQPEHARQHSGEHSEVGARTADSTAIVDGKAASGRTAVSTPTAQPPPAENAGTKGALSDPDPDHGSLRDHDPGDPPVVEDDGEEGGDAAKVSARAARIPERAWLGADHLRALVLEHDPGNIVSRKPWGPEVKRGVRLAWADELRLMVERDGRDLETIGRTMNWLFRGQTAEPQYRLIVLSAGALRAKWDRIQQARQRQAAAQANPSSGRPAAPSAYTNPPERQEWKRR